MAPITPYQQGTVGSFETRSRPYGDIPANKAGGLALEGLGKGLGLAISGVEELDKAKVEMELLQRVTQGKESNIAIGKEILQGTVGAPGTIPAASPATTRVSVDPAYSAQQAGAPGGEATGGQGTAIYNPTIDQMGANSRFADPALQYVEPGPTAIQPPAGGLPAPVAGALDRAARIAQAAKLGKWDDINYSGDMIAVSKELSERYPHIAPYIHAKMREFFGADPYNMQRTAIQRTLETIYAGKQSARDKWINDMERDRKYLTPEQHRQALSDEVINDPKKQNEWRVLIGELQYIEHEKEKAQKQLVTQKAAGEVSSELAINHLHQQTALDVRKTFLNAQFHLSGGQSANLQDTFLNIDKLKGPDGRIPDKIRGNLVLQLHQVRDAIDLRITTEANSAAYSPYFKSNEEIKHFKDRYLAPIDTIINNINNNNTYLAAIDTQALQNITTNAELEVMRNDKFARFAGVQKALGPIGSKMLDEYIAIKRPQFIQAVQELDVFNKKEVLNPTPGGNNSLQGLMERYDRVAPSTPTISPEQKRDKHTFMREVIDFPKHVLLNPQSTIVEQTNAATFISSPENIRFINSFPPAEKFQVWSSIYAPEITKKMAEVGQSNPAIHQRYLTTGKSIFQQLYITNQDTINTALEVGKHRIEFNEATGQIDTDRRLPTARGRLDASSLPLDRNSELAINNLNVGLKTYKNILESEGDKLTAEHLENIIGIKLPVKGATEKPTEGRSGALPFSPEETTASRSRDIATSPAQQAITQAIGGRKYREPASPQVQEAIDIVSKGTGRSPALIAAMAHLESDMGRKLGGTYRGVFQQGGTNVRAGEDPDNPITNANITVRTMLANDKELTRALGRKPVDHEDYLAHQQGANGAQALIRGAEEGLTAVEALKKYARLTPATAMENLRNNRLPDIRDTPLQNLSATAFVESWRNAVEQAKRAYGGTGKRSDIPFAEEGTIVSDVSPDLPVAGQQYAGMLTEGRQMYPSRPQAEGGGGLAPRTSEQVAKGIRETSEMVEGEQTVPQPGPTARRPITAGGLRTYDRELGRVREGEGIREGEPVQPGQFGRIPEDMRTPRQQRNINRREADELTRQANRELDTLYRENQTIGERVQRNLEATTLGQTPLTPRQQRARGLDQAAYERVFNREPGDPRPTESDRRRANRESLRRLTEEHEQLQTTLTIPSSQKFQDVRIDPKNTVLEKFSIRQENTGGFEILFKPKGEKGKEIEMNGYLKDPQTLYVARMSEKGKSVFDTKSKWSIDMASGMEIFRTLRRLYPQLEEIHGFRTTGIRGGATGYTKEGLPKDLQIIRIPKSIIDETSPK